MRLYSSFVELKTSIPHDDSCGTFYSAACAACRSRWPAADRVQYLLSRCANSNLRVMTAAELFRGVAIAEGGDA